MVWVFFFFVVGGLFGWLVEGVGCGVCFFVWFWLIGLFWWSFCCYFVVVVVAIVIVVLVELAFI